MTRPLRVLAISRNQKEDPILDLLHGQGQQTTVVRNTREARRRIQREIFEYVVMDRDTFLHLSSPQHMLQQITLPEYVEQSLQGYVQKLTPSTGEGIYDLLMRQVERPLIQMVLERTRGNQVQASKILGMSRNTLRKKIRELRIPIRRRGGS